MCLGVMPLKNRTDMNTPKLSVVIPLYNKESTIKRAVDSVLSQTRGAFNLIVVDDGSNDGGPDLVREVQDTRVRLVEQENAGVSAARNRGVAASGEGLIAFLDADDWWDPELLEELLRLRDKFPEAGLYAVGYRQILPNGRYSTIHVDTGANAEDILIDDYLSRTRGGNFVHSSSVMIPFERLKEVGGFPLGEKFGEDLLVWAKIGLMHPIAASSKVLGNFSLDIANTAPRHQNIPDRHPLLKYLAFESTNPELSQKQRSQAKRALKAKIFQVAHYIARAGTAQQLKAFLEREEHQGFAGILKLLVSLPFGLKAIQWVHACKRAKAVLLLRLSGSGSIVRYGVVQSKIRNR